MASIDWDNFTAFAGPAVLHSDILRPTRRADQTLNLEQDVLQFYQWLDILRNTGLNGANDCGIPQNRQQEVRDLLNTFFPSGHGTPAGRLEPVRVLDTPNPDGTRAAQPMTVHFGPQSLALEIVDGPSALGYIFSVVQPTIPNLGWDTYFLPLLVFFSRCLFLAYVSPSPTGATAPISEVSNVPWMSCIMYDAGSAPPSYMLGSNWTLAITSVASQQLLRVSRQLLLDAWRRQGLLEGALPHIPSHLPVQIPGLEPAALPKLAEEFYKDCVGRGLRGRPALISDTASSAMFTLVAGDFVTAYAAQGNGLCVPLDAAEILSVQSTRPTLLTLAANLLQQRFSPNFDPADPAFLQGLQSFLYYFLVPHMFSPAIPVIPGGTPPPDLTLPEITAVPASTAVIIQTEMAIIWTTFGAAALTRLTDFYGDRMYYGASSLGWVPFGRCAETYPFGVMLPSYFPNIDMARIRGFSLENRRIGASLSFEQHFNSDQVDIAAGTLTTKSPYRYPCVNCTNLIPIWTMAARAPPCPTFDPTPGPTYDADLIRTPKTRAPV